MPQLLAKFVPLVQTLILVGIDVRARSRFDRLTHHAHGHGGWIAAGGDVGSRFPVARSVDDGASATGVCIQMYTTCASGLKMIAMLRLFFTAHRGICACGWGTGSWGRGIGIGVVRGRE